MKKILSAERQQTLQANNHKSAKIAKKDKKRP